jgi:sugar diacid utilization regulator
MAAVEEASLLARVEFELAELVARSAGRGDLIASLENALGCRLRVLPADAPGDDATISHAIAPGTELLGRLQSDIPVAFASWELGECLEYGARIIGVELVRERAARETRWSLEAELLTELVEVGAQIPERLCQRARHAGFDLARRWHVLLLAVDDDALPAELVAAARRRAMHDERAMTCRLGARLAVAVCDEPGDARDNKLCDLQRVARGLGVALRVGVSSPGNDFACGVRQAEAALRLASCGQQPGTVYHEHLGSLRFLLNAPDQGELMSLVITHIGPLAEHDRERQSDLLATLRVFLDKGGNQRRAAERCCIHMSTLKYRLRRIQDLLDRDLADATVRFDLMLALKVLDLLRAADADPMAVVRMG